MTLPHLSGEGAAIRQVLAAYFLRNCRHIVEIGGAGAPITDFLTHSPESVTVVDPKIEPLERDEWLGRPCRVRHVAMKFQATSFDAPAEALGVVMLGLSLKPLGARPAINDALVTLLRRATVVALDYSLRLDRAVDQAPQLIADAGLTTAVAIDLAIADGVLDESDHARRRFMVLRPARALA